MSGFTGLKSYGLILWSFFVFFLSNFTACCHWECSCWMRFWENCFCTPYSCNLTDISLVKMVWGEHCVWSSAGSSSLSAVFLVLRWTGSSSITHDRGEIWSSSSLDQSPGRMKDDVRWAVSLSRAQHEYRSSLWAGDSSVSLRRAPGGFSRSEACVVKIPV